MGHCRSALFPLPPSLAVRLPTLNFLLFLFLLAQPWGGSPFKAGIFGGEVLDGPGVVAISKLPTKQELMGRLAVAINSVPTKLGRSINLVPTKVGRAVKLAFAPEGEDGEGASAEEAAPDAAAE